jgi:hypothetical protein
MSNLKTKPSYWPIYLIFTYTILANLLIALPNHFSAFMPNFMASLFLVFSFFKMLDLQGFANSYGNYDLIAKKFRSYAYIYPFLEAFFGCSYIVNPHSSILNLSVFIVMLISTIGVITAKLKKQQFSCACVGTFLQVPLGNIAIIEDLLMMMMAFFMLLPIPV